MAAAEIDLSVSLVALKDLAPYERNARTHPQSQIDEIKASIRSFGFANPIIADLSDGGVIAAGHGRELALSQMFDSEEVILLPNGSELPAGMAPVMDCSGWSVDQRRAYTLADNKIALNSGWDDELLKIELGELLEMGDDAAPVIGFSDDELSDLVEGIGDGSGKPDNYSRKIEAPIYEPKGDKPELAELFDTTKRDALIEEIKDADLPEDVENFLRAAAERHTVIDFERVAEFYCHADTRTQDLMEKSALVIIDFDKAVEAGFVELGSAIGNAWEKDHGDGE